MAARDIDNEYQTYSVSPLFRFVRRNGPGKLTGGGIDDGLGMAESSPCSRRGLTFMIVTADRVKLQGLKSR